MNLILVRPHAHLCHLRHQLLGSSAIRPSITSTRLGGRSGRLPPRWDCTRRPCPASCGLRLARCRNGSPAGRALTPIYRIWSNAGRPAVPMRTSSLWRFRRRAFRPVTPRCGNGPDAAARSRDSPALYQRRFVPERPHARLRSIGGRWSPGSCADLTRQRHARKRRSPRSWTLSRRSRRRSR